MQNVALQLKIPKGAPSNPDSFPFEAESIPILLAPLRSNTTPIPTTPVTPQSKIFGLSNLPELFQFTTPRPSNPVLPQFLRTGNPSVPTTQSSLPPSSAPHSPVSQLSSPSLSANKSDSSSEGNMGNLWDEFDSESGSESLAHESATEHGDWANSCTGQLIQWLPGSVWDLYAYHRHTDNSLPWTLISVEDPDWIRIPAKRCNFLLHTELEQNRRACVPCQKLAIHSNKMYLSTHKKFNDLKLKSLNSARRIKSLRKRVTEGQQLVMLMSKHKIASVSRILSVALRNGASPAAIHEKLEMAISGAYTPQSKWTNRELDVAFLIKLAAGLRLLYTLQRKDGYPSQTTLYCRKNIPKLRMSVGIPNAIKINKNIETFLGSITGRQCPETLSRGQTVMIDGLALEEVPRYDMT
ncbi:hypothetical protein B0H34DRAFT_677283 [Crassisporium funariophilum]|nr:hypothetical protein B0H34DRAFT_677283 [Crassisporium funariophilum]